MSDATNSSMDQSPISYLYCFTAEQTRRQKEIIQLLLFFLISVAGDSYWISERSYSKAMLGYSWNSKSSTGSNGIKSNDYNYKRTMNPYADKSSSYRMDMKSRQQSASTIPKSFLRSQQIGL
uniref:YTH domain-containing protein n=1 Tax=Tanacetum cinerariifolium TaxID=118510 RepID=A0A699IKI4_TANCI|nr:YTH domain-containing protein [Tanacetum cinerariifolium]